MFSGYGKWRQPGCCLEVRGQCAKVLEEMQQGGIDEKENPEEAVWREMMEEIGTNNADLFKISRG